MTQYQCTPGSAKLAGSCELCPPGTFSLGDLSQMCTPVPKGYFNPDYNSSTYLPCATSFFTGAANCDEGPTNCDMGYYYSNEAGSCQAAPAGYYVPLDGLAVYYACPPGTYASSEGSGTCESVDIGQYNPFSAATAPYGSCSTSTEEAAVNCVTDAYIVVPALASTVVNASMGLNGPVGIAAHSSGYVYFTDTDNHRVRQLTTAGLLRSLAGSYKQVSGFVDGIGTVARFNSPSGITVDLGQTIYVADTNNNRIRKITSSGAVSTLVGSSTSGWLDGLGTNTRFTLPVGIAVDTNFVLFVTDYNAVRRITSAGAVTTLAGSNTADSTSVLDGIGTAATLLSPFGICVDTVGLVYVVDGGHGLIRTIESDASSSNFGLVQTLAGTGGDSYTDGAAMLANLNSPYGIAVDSSRNLYFSSTGYGIVRQLSSNGVIISLAGTSSNAFTVDGVGTIATFESPKSVTVDSNGDLYVADSFSNTIRKVTKTNVACSKGEYFNGAFCTATPLGYFVPENAPSILYGCPPGTYNLDTGMTTCVSSPYGNFTPTAGHYQYYPCPNDTYYFIEGAGECKKISAYPTSFPTIVHHINKPNYVFLIVFVVMVVVCLVACVGGCICYYRCWRESDEEHHQHHHRHDLEFGIESDTTIQVHAVSDYNHTRSSLISPSTPSTDATGTSSPQVVNASLESPRNRPSRGDHAASRQVVTVVRAKHTGAQGHVPVAAQAVDSHDGHELHHEQPALAPTVATTAAGVPIVPLLNLGSLSSLHNNNATSGRLTNSQSTRSLTAGTNSAHNTTSTGGTVRSIGTPGSGHGGIARSGSVSSRRGSNSGVGFQSIPRGESVDSNGSAGGSITGRDEGAVTTARRGIFTSMSSRSMGLNGLFGGGASTPSPPPAEIAATTATARAAATPRASFAAISAVPALPLGGLPNTPPTRSASNSPHSVQATSPPSFDHAISMRSNGGTNRNGAFTDRSTSEVGLGTARSNIARTVSAETPQVSARDGGGGGGIMTTRSFPMTSARGSNGSLSARGGGLTNIDTDTPPPVSSRNTTPPSSPRRPGLLGGFSFRRGSGTGSNGASGSETAASPRPGLPPRAAPSFRTPPPANPANGILMSARSSGGGGGDIVATARVYQSLDGDELREGGWAF